MTIASFKKHVKVILAQSLVFLLILTTVMTASAADIASTNVTWDFSPYTSWQQNTNLTSIIDTENFPGLVSSGVNSTSEMWILESGVLEVVGTGRLIIEMAENSPFTALFSDSGSGLRPTVMVGTTANGPWTQVTPTYTSDTNGITLSLDGIGEGNCYVQYIISGTDWSSYWNHKLRTVSFNEYVPIEYVSVECTDGVTVDNNQATTGEIVTITVADSASVKAAGLTVLDGDGDKVAVSRVGFREGGTASKYTFTMPAVAPVTVELEQIDSASQTSANIGGLGAQLRLASDTTNGGYDGIRFGTQLRYDTENGAVNIGGTDYTVVKCGTIVTRTDILEYLCGKTAKEDYFTIDGWATDKNAKYLINIPQTKVYDKCDEYIEFVGGITGLTSAHYDYEFAARGYVVVKLNDSEYTFYTDIMTAAPNEIMVKTMDTKVVFNKQINTKYYDFRECDSRTNNEFYGGATRGVFPNTMPYEGGQASITMRTGKNSPVVVCYTYLSGYTKTPTYYVSADKVTWTAVTPDVLDKADNGDTRAIFNSIGSDNMFFRFEFPQTSSDTIWSLSLQSISYNSIGGVVESNEDIDISKITAEALERSILDEGNTARLAKVLKKAANKEKIVIGTIGGSITEGTAASSASLTSYASNFRNWLCEQYPDTPIEFYNVGRGATTSLMHAHTVATTLLDKNPDLVIVEFSCNDTPGSTMYQESYESLIRQILSDEKAPAVICLYLMNNEGNSAIDIHLPVAQHYDLPSISYKAAVWPEDGEKLYEWEELSPDEVHPNDLGHAVIARLLTNYIEKVRTNLDELSTEISAIPSAFTDNSYANAKWLNALNTTPTAIDTFKTNVYSWQFAGGWTTTSGGSLTIEVTDAKNINLMWLSMYNGRGGTAIVKLDGELVATLNADKYITWGECTLTTELLKSDTAGTHTIEIEVISSDPTDEFTIQGILVS